jgi:hypothetical protein
MSRRRKPTPLPKPVAPLPPSRHQGWSKGQLDRRRLAIIRQDARWWRQRDNESHRKARDTDGPYPRDSMPDKEE